MRNKFREKLKKIVLSSIVYIPLFVLAAYAIGFDTVDTDSQKLDQYQIVEDTTLVPTSFLTPTPSVGVSKVDERSINAAYSLFYRLNSDGQDELISNYSDSNDAQEAIYNYAERIKDDKYTLEQIEELVFKVDKEDDLFIVGSGAYTKDSIWHTHYQGSDGVSGSSYTDSIGVTHYSDNTGYSSDTYYDSIGGSHTTDNDGYTIDSYTNSLGTNYYGDNGYEGRSHSSTIGTHYTDNQGNTINCYESTLGTNCY